MHGFLSFLSRLRSLPKIVSYRTFASCVLDGVECGSDEYNAYVIPTFLAAFIYAVGVPTLFMFLVYKYKDRGRAGDRTVQRAFGGMFAPFRPGREWWLGAEYV